MKMAVTKSYHRRAFMYLKAEMGSRHFLKCDLQYLGTDSWKNILFVLLVLVITFKKKKWFPPTNLKLISCLPAGRHKWKHFHNEKTDQNMFHIWQVQIQRKQSLELTIIFWVRNFLVRVSKLESSLFQKRNGKKKWEKSGKLQHLLPLRVPGHTDLVPDQGWAGSWHSTDGNQPPFFS